MRRMLDLRHPSVVSELEYVAGMFGKRFVHEWSTTLNVSGGVDRMANSKGNSD